MVVVSYKKEETQNMAYICKFTGIDHKIVSPVIETVTKFRTFKFLESFTLKHNIINWLQDSDFECNKKTAPAIEFLELTEADKQFQCNQISFPNLSSPFDSVGFWD